MPIDPADYALWRALCGTINTPPPESTLSCGFYRLDRTSGLAPIAIYRDAEAGCLVMEIYGKVLREDDDAQVEKMLEFEFGDWRRVRAVTEQQYRDALGLGRWWDSTPVFGADDAIPAADGGVTRSHNQPPEPVAPATAAPKARGIKAEKPAGVEIEVPDKAALTTEASYDALRARYAALIESFLVLVRGLPREPAAGATEADMATYAAEKLKAVGRHADTARRMQTLPLREEEKRINGAWNAVIDRANKEARDLQQKVVDPYARRLLEEKRRAEEAARQKAMQTGRDEDFAAARHVADTKVRVGGAGGKATIREYEAVTVSDPKALAAYLLSMPDPPTELLDALRKAAQRMVAANAHQINPIPGIVVTKEIRR